MPGHGAQICAQAPTKGYVQTGARAPGTGRTRHGHGHYYFDEISRYRALYI